MCSRIGVTKPAAVLLCPPSPCSARIAWYCLQVSALFHYSSLHCTNLEPKVQAQCHGQPNSHNQRARSIIEIRPTSFHDQLSPPHVDAVAPNQGEQCHACVDHGESSGNIVSFPSSVVQAQREGSKQDRNVLPLDESPLVRKPNLGFYFHRAPILDPYTRMPNARWELHLILCLLLLSRILACGKGWEEACQASAATERSVVRSRACYIVVTVGLFIIKSRLGGLFDNKGRWFWYGSFANRCSSCSRGSCRRDDRGAVTRTAKCC